MVVVTIPRQCIPDDPAITDLERVLPSPRRRLGDPRPLRLVDGERTRGSRMDCRGGEPASRDPTSIFRWNRGFPRRTWFTSAHWIPPSKTACHKPGKACHAMAEKARLGGFSRRLDVAPLQFLIVFLIIPMLGFGALAFFDLSAQARREDPSMQHGAEAGCSRHRASRGGQEEATCEGVLAGGPGIPTSQTIGGDAGGRRPPKRSSSTSASKTVLKSPLRWQRSPALP
jgi:hypothetical protein